MEKVAAIISGTTQPLNGRVIARIWEEILSNGRLEWGGFFVLPEAWPSCADGPYVFKTVDGRRGEIHIHDTSSDMVCFKGVGNLRAKIDVNPELGIKVVQSK